MKRVLMMMLVVCGVAMAYERIPVELNQLALTSEGLFLLDYDADSGMRGILVQQLLQEEGQYFVEVNFDDGLGSDYCPRCGKWTLNTQMKRCFNPQCPWYVRN